MVRYHSTKCIACGKCVQACAPQCFAAAAEGAVDLKYPEGCNSCGHCIAVCPTGAVILPGAPSESFRSWKRPEIAPEDMKELMLGRRSIRVYEDRQVPDEDIRSLLEAACHAGTSSNGQSEGFIVLQNPGRKQELEYLVVDALWNAGLRFLGNPVLQWILAHLYNPEMIRQYLAYYDRTKRHRKKDGGKGQIFRNAPTVIIVQGLKRNPLAKSNAAIAIRNIEILAETMGIGTCWVGFMPVAAASTGKINRFLGIPRGRTVVGALMVGFPKEHYSKVIPRADRTGEWIR